MVIGDTPKVITFTFYRILVTGLLSTVSLEIIWEPGVGK